MHTNRGAPTPPIEFGADPASVSERFGGPRHQLDDSQLDQLRDVCSEVISGGHGELDEAGRDWWPLALTWAVDGKTPARPSAIARPGTASEVAGVLGLAARWGVPVTPAAGRSGVCGASVPAFGGIALDMTAMAGVVDVDDASLVLDVLPGTFGDVLEDDIRTAHGVTVGHWPQSMALSTVGGWLACRGAGQYSTRYGKIEDMVVGLEVALADGRVIRTGGAGPRAAVGPDLTQLFVGSEGTLGVITEAWLRVHPVPTEERRSAWSFDTFASGLDVCRRILRRGATPAVLRLYDVPESARNFDLERNALIVLDEGDAAIVDAVASIVAEECARTDGVVREDDAQVERWMGHRNDVSALPKLVQRGIVLDTVEIAAKWSVLPKLYDDAIAALRGIDGVIAASAHQSHSYLDGACLYFTWAARLPDGAAIGGPESDALYVAAWDAVTSAVLAAGGALSHHHGVGLNRGRFMPDALGGAFDTLVAVKSALDPKGILNPGKLGLPTAFGPPPWPTS